MTAPRARPSLPTFGRDGNVQELIEVGDERMGRGRPVRDIASDPLAWLDQRNILRDPLSIGLLPAQLQATRGAAMYRLQAGQKARAMFSAGKVAPIRSIDFGMPPAGSSGSQFPAASVIANIKDAGRLKATMNAEAFQLLRDVTADDVWPWKGLSLKDRRAVYDRVRHSLDCAAVFFGLMRMKDFRVRWPDARTP